MNIDIKETLKGLQGVKQTLWLQGFVNDEKIVDDAIKALEQQQARIEKLKAESQANLDGWKQARRIIDKMNKRLRK